MLMDGMTTSSLVMVPVAVAVPMVELAEAPERVTSSVSLASTVVSPLMVTLMVPVVAPAAIVRVPEVAT